MIIFILLILKCLSLAIIEVQSSSSNLKLIQVIFRHGERAPSLRTAKIYPLDPYVNETWYPEGWSGLNNIGKKSAYDLGHYLRERYGKWLGDVYLDDEVQFRSSRVSRIMMSTQLVAAGIFPPSAIQRWNPDINWQPIPVYLEPFKINIYSLCEYMCPRHVAMRRELLETDAFLLSRNESLREFFQFMSANVGANVGQKDMLQLYNQLNTERSQNLTLPKWTEGIFPHGKLEEVSSFNYVINSYNKSMIQLDGGLWVNDWLENVDSVLNRTESGGRKALFYGGHESTIASILTALGVFELHVPYYNSAIMFELSGAQDDFYVKVSYRNRGLLRELLIPGCASTNCPLATFRRLFADITVEDPEALCQGN